MGNSNILFGMFAGLFITVSFLLLGGLFFRNELVQWMKDMAKPSEKSIRQQSQEMLEKMDRNVAARNEKKLR